MAKNVSFKTSRRPYTVYFLIYSGGFALYFIKQSLKNHCFYSGAYVRFLNAELGVLKETVKKRGKKTHVESKC